MGYSYTRLCSGSLNKPEPCKYIDSCNLCIGFQLDEDGNEHYIIGRGCNAMKCKRDNADYKPMTKQQFIEIYKKMPNMTNISLGELLECARINGMVEGQLMCEYCENGKNIELTSDSAKSYWFIIHRNGVARLYCKMGENQLGNCYGIEISHCPMCGRKLSGMED